MKRTIRRWITMAAILFASVMTFCLPVHAEEITFSYDDSTRTLSFSGKGELIIRSACRQYKEAERLIIHEGITSIEEEAFRGFRELEYIELPSSVKVIGAYAFTPAHAPVVVVNTTSERYHEKTTIEEGNDSLLPKIKFKYGPNLDSIKITAMPVKTAYQEGEYFDPTGMIVSVRSERNYLGSGFFLNNDIDYYTIEDDGPLQKGQTSVCISYTMGYQYRRAFVPVTVE